MCRKEMFVSILSDLWEQRVGLAEEMEGCEPESDQGCDSNARKCKQCHFNGSRSLEVWTDEGVRNVVRI